MKSLARATTTLAATSGALFALQHRTEAAVIYSGLQNVTVSVDRSTHTLTQALGLANLRLALHRTTGLLQFSLRGSGEGFLVNNAGSQALARLAAGQLVSAGKTFYSGEPHGLLKSVGGDRGTWAQSQTGFAGVMFQNGDLGWVRLLRTDIDNTQTLTAIDWAYNDTAGASILTGEGIPTTPEPSRALLLLAGAGTLALRRRRK